MKSLQSLSQTLFIVALVCGASVSRTAAVQQSQHQRLSATQSVASANSRHLTALPQPAFSINSLHTSPLVNGTSETSSLAGNLTGIKPGLPATCYGQPCSTSACFPAATVAVRQHVNYVNVTAFVELERSYNISTCNDVTSNSCEVKVNGTASLVWVQQKSTTIYKIRVQMAKEGLSQLWWTPTDCSGTVTWVLLSNITYDITPPALALLTTSGSSNKTVATSLPISAVPSWAYSDTGVHTRLRRHARRLHFFGIQSASASSASYGADVVFSFSEPVTGFAQRYAFVKGGSVSGLNETVSQQQYRSTILADSTSTKSMLIMVTGSTYQDLAGNVGTGDLNATVTASVLSTASTDGSTASSSDTRKKSGSIAGGVVAGVVLALILLCLALWCWRRRREQAPTDQTSSNVDAAGTTAPTTSSKSVAKGDQLNVNASAPTAVPLEVQFGTATLNTATTADPNTFSYTVYFVSVSASPTTWVCTAVAKGDQLNVNASVPTAVPLRVRFGTGTPNAATAANLTMFSNPMYPGSQSHAQESRSELAPTRSELPVSTVGGGRSSDEELDQASEQTTAGLAQGDSSSKEAELDSQPSGPLIHDPTVAFGSPVAYGSGSYEGHIMSYNSIVAAEDGEVTNQETGAGTARARPWSRLAMASTPSNLPRGTTQAGSRAWGDVPLSDEE